MLAVGDPDGFGQFGVLEEDDEGLQCHECGRRFTHLGLHAFKAHGMSADEYRQAHGLRRRGLVAAATRAVIVENARRALPGRAAFIAARDPKTASAAQQRGTDAISPAGLAAIRAYARSRRGTQRFGTVITCEWCGVEFCPLVSAARRRFCSRSCASKHTRRRASRSSG